VTAPTPTTATGAPNDSTFRTQRILRHPPARVFDAFVRPDVLARWWGPSGFTNAFEVFEFRPGGRWKYVMHGPDGKHYPNESLFLEVEPPSKVVIHHVSLPRYVLTIGLDEEGSSETRITWNQEFESAVAAARLRHIVEPANEQNLDRLEKLLGGLSLSS